MSRMLPAQIELLRHLIEAEDAHEGRESFHLSSTFEGASVSHPGLPNGFISVHWGDVTLLAERGLLHVTSRGEHQLAFDIAPEAREELEAAMTLDLHTARFHIEILLADGKTRDFEIDLSEDQAREVARRYAAGATFLVNGRKLARTDIQRLRISATEKPAAIVRAEIEAEPRRTEALRVQRSWQLNVVDRGRDVTRGFLEDVGLADLAKAEEPISVADKKTVFVVHGRNEKARRAMFSFLRALKLHPLEWSEAVKATGAPNPYVGDVLAAALARAQAILVLLTPDDHACLREHLRRANDPRYETELTPQSRPNVLFEAGMAMGRDENRTVLVELGELRPFSDIGGRHVVRLDDSVARRQDVVDRLQLAGCAVDPTSGRDWHTEGEFEAAIVTGTSDPET